MPVTVNKSVAPEVVSAQEQGVKLIKESPTGYFFRMPVVVKDRILDLTDIPAGFVVTASLRENQKSVLLKVKDGVKVQVADTFDSRTKIHVQTESGDHSIGRGYVYYANDNKKNINGKYKFNDPSFVGSSVDKTLELKEAMYKGRINFGESDIIYCRHLSNAALALRDKNGPYTWKEARDKYFAIPNLHKTFSNRERSEFVSFDFLYGTENIVNIHRLNLGKALKAQLMELSKDIKANETREKKYYLILENPEDLGGVNHACAMVLRAKCDAAGEVVHKIKLYDPNISYNHVSFADDSPDLALVNDLTFEELFPLADSYEKYKQIMIHELNKDWDQGVPQAIATNLGSNTVHNYIYDEANDRLVIASEEPLAKYLDVHGFKKIMDKKDDFVDEVI